MNKRIDRNSIESKKDAVDEIFGRHAREGLEHLNKSEWIEWKGGECPVDGDTIIYVKCVNGSVYENLMAKYESWEIHADDHVDYAINVTHYRVNSKSKEQSEEWDKLNPENLKIGSFIERVIPIVSIQPPDPHKEWVKIQDGCQMPGNGEDVYTRVEIKGGSNHKILCYQGWLFFDEQDMPVDNVSHWRYPHPDPED